MDEDWWFSPDTKAMVERIQLIAYLDQVAIMDILANAALIIGRDRKPPSEAFEVAIDWAITNGNIVGGLEFHPEIDWETRNFKNKEIQRKLINAMQAELANRELLQRLVFETLERRGPSRTDPEADVIINRVLDSLKER